MREEVIYQCCICECEEGEFGHHLRMIHTKDGTLVPICNVCDIISSRYVLQKCRLCGAVGTVPKDKSPMAGHQQAAILFFEGCIFCGKNQEQAFAGGKPS